jgi:hypothetical protein
MLGPKPSVLPLHHRAIPAEAGVRRPASENILENLSHSGNPQNPPSERARKTGQTLVSQT